MGGLRDALRSLAASAAAGLAATPVIIAFTDNVATIACCEGRSMQPTINRIGGMSAVVLLDKWSGRSSRFDRGDVVVLNSPTHDGSMVLKRILALGGDYVKRADGRGEPIHVPKGHCWVEGDNPAVSHDSNAFGPVRAPAPRSERRQGPPRRAGAGGVRQPAHADCAAARSAAPPRRGAGRCLSRW